MIFAPDGPGLICTLREGAIATAATADFSGRSSTSVTGMLSTMTFGEVSSGQAGAKFRLRVAGAADVSGIAALIAASVRGLQTGDYNARQIEGALQTVFTVDSQLIADGTYFVAFAADGTLAGCGGWSYRETLYGGDAQMEPVTPGRLNPAVDAAKVRAIFVAPQFARQGLGTLLLSAAEDAARAAGFRRFEMGSTLTGVALYALRGYREVSRVAAPVGSGECIEVVRMEKAVE